MQPDIYRIRFTGSIGPARNGTNLFIREILHTEALKALLFAVFLRVIMPAAASLLCILNSEEIRSLGTWLVHFSRAVCTLTIVATFVMFVLELDPNWDWLVNPFSYIRLPDYKYSFDLELIFHRRNPS